MTILERFAILIFLELLWLGIGKARGRVVTWNESSGILLGIMGGYFIWLMVVQP